MIMLFVILCLRIRKQKLFQKSLLFRY